MDSAKDKYVPGKKLIFLDFDGTLAYWGSVPPGHARAIHELQANGHLVFLCTGRPLSGVSDDVRALGFDGFVCAAGGYVLIDGHVLADRRFEEEVANRAVDLLDGYEGIYILESPNHVYVRTASEARLRKLFRTHLDMLDRLRVHDDLHGVSFSKIDPNELTRGDGIGVPRIYLSWLTVESDRYGQPTITDSNWAIVDGDIAIGG